MKMQTIVSKSEFYVYGEHIANKLWSTGRACQEKSIGQHHIKEICFNLIIGVYSHNNILYLPLNSGANFLEKNL